VRLRSDGANLAAVLLRLQQEDIQRYKTIVRQVARVLPGFADFELQPAFGKVALRWRGTYGDKTFGAHLTSDGSLRLFCLLTLLNLSPDALPDVLFIDEPELGLHPHAMALVAEMLKKLSHTRQVFIATQSPYLVDCFELENIIVADIKDGSTSLRNMTREKYQEWLDDDYLLSPLAQGRGGSGPVTRLCVICEGHTEAQFVKDCLEPHLRQHNLVTVPSILKSKPGRPGGGAVTVERLARHVSHEYHHFDHVTTLVDY